MYFDYSLTQFREQIAANSGNVRYCDMTGLFQNVAAQTFTDSVHLASQSNELVANAFCPRSSKWFRHALRLECSRDAAGAPGFIRSGSR